MPKIFVLLSSSLFAIPLMLIITVAFVVWPVGEKDALQPSSPVACPSSEFLVPEAA